MQDTKRRGRGWMWMMVAVFIGGAAWIPAAEATGEGAMQDTVTVMRVMEGDQLEVTGGRVVHLAGVNALSPYSGTQVQAWAEATAGTEAEARSLGRMARTYAEDLVKGKRVVLEAASGLPADRVYVWVLRGSSRAFMLNARLILDGYAYARTRAHPQHEAFASYEAEAQAAKRGLWGNTVLPALRPLNISTPLAGD